MTKSFFEKSNIEYLEETSLKNHNTYRINTIAKYLIYPKNEIELIEVLKYIKNEKIKHLIIGNGSNIILTMDYFDGIVIKLDRFDKLEYDNNLVTVGAGYSLTKLAIETIKKGLSGLEFAAGIPGKVGASIAMNAGAYNSDMSNVVKKIKVLTPDLEVIEMDKSELNFEYRDSFLKKHKEYYVLSAVLELTQGNTEEMLHVVDERRKKRIKSQPLEMPSAGSVFRNPEGMHAGALIENANLKGYQINGAEVSTKHANFIVNTGTASGKDVVALIEKIKKEIKDKYDVELKLEQIIIE